MSGLAVGLNQTLYEAELPQGEHPHLQQHPETAAALSHPPIDKGLLDLKCNVAAQPSIDNPRKLLKVLKINNSKQGLAMEASVCFSVDEHSWWKVGLEV